MPELEAYEEAERLGLADGWDVSRTLLKTARANQWKRRGAKPRREPAKSAPVAHQDVTPPPVAWRERALLFVNYCQEQLHADAGRLARDYLHGRGLRDDTIERWGLGWHDKDRWRDPQQWGLTGKKVWLACGVVIPWTVAGAVWQVKIRRFGDTGPLTKTGSKYAQITQGILVR